MAAPEYATSPTAEQTVRLDALLRLFNQSVLKQQKYHALVCLLGQTEDLTCLDIGSGNGVISHLLRQRGGEWISADLTVDAVNAIRSVLGDAVHLPDGARLPFADNAFDRVVVIDYLEHIADDAGFMAEVYRILRPGGQVIINVPHQKKSLLRLLRHAIGQTDAAHGHLRPGYTLAELQLLLGDQFTVAQAETYSKFFSEFIDTLINFAVGIVKRKKSDAGRAVTAQDFSANQKLFRVYALLYPVLRLFALFDNLLFFRSGYLLIVRARFNKVED